MAGREEVEEREIVEEEGAPEEDLEAFLAELEGEEPPEASAPVASAAPDPLADEFAALEREAPPVESEPAPEEPRARKKKKKKKDAKAIAVVERETPRSWRWAAAIGRLALIAVPLVALTWIVGALVGGWVEAGWVVAVVALGVVLLVPTALRLATGRGRWGSWAGIVSAIALAALLFAAPALTARHMVHYGHWPGSAVAGLAHWEPDGALVRASGFAGRVVGDAIAELAGVEPIAPHASLALGLDRDLKTWAAERRAQTQAIPAPPGAGAGSAAP